MCNSVVIEEVEPVTCVQPWFEVRRVGIDSMQPDGQLPVVDEEVGSESIQEVMHADRCWPGYSPENSIFPLVD